MSLIEGRDKDRPQLTASLVEANLHSILSALASDYVKLLKKTVLPDLGLKKKYTVRDMQILAALFEAPKPMTSTDIFKQTGLDPATVTRSTKILHQDGFIASTENAADSRSRYLHLTEEGVELAKKYNVACQSLFDSNDLTVVKPDLSELESLERRLKKLQTRVKILNLKKF